MRQYTLSDEAIRTSPPQWAKERPDWISRVKSGARLYVSDQDMVRIDTSARESLVILSNMDAYMSSIQRTVTSTSELDIPFVVRALRSVGSMIGDVARLLVHVSHQASLHRRDAALWDAKARQISSRLFWHP